MSTLHYSLHKRDQAFSVPLNLRCFVFQCCSDPSDRLAHFVQKIVLQCHNHIRVKRERAGFMVPGTINAAITRFLQISTSPEIRSCVSMSTLL